MIYFAIRQISTGYLFPHRRGASSKAEFEKGNIPRLFKTRGHAKLCLTNWKEGIHYIKRYTNYDGEYDESWECNEINERKKDDYEIIKFNLKEII
jgi:hypothetical protein